MAKQHWIVVLEQATWRAAHVSAHRMTLSDAAPLDRRDLAASADLMQAALVEQGYDGSPILLALGSSWCVTATLSAPSARHARNRSAMAYLMESYLPWAVEHAVVDYELTGTTAFLVAAELAPLAALMRALEEQGVRVDSIAPLARLALEEHLSKAKDAPERHALLWEHDETVELWLLDRGRPIAWRRLPRTADAVRRSLSQLALAEDDSLVVLARGRQPQVMESLLADPDLTQCEVDDTLSMLDACLRQGAAVLDGRCAAAIELRRDALAATDRHRAVRRHLGFLQAAAALFLAAVGIALFLQANRHDAARQALGERQMEVFRELFPNRRVPIGVRAQLESELARLKGMRGQDAALPEVVSSLEILQRLLRALPTDIRFRLLEVRIDHGKLYLVGQTRSHADADRLAAALRAEELQVAPATTHRLAEKGVEFRISAAVLPATDEEPRT